MKVCKPEVITSIVAHIDHGKTTLVDSLIAAQGVIPKTLAGDVRYLDTRGDEQERGITLKLSVISLTNHHTIIDTPGHVDFEALIQTSALLADNFLILIDVNEGITPRTFALFKYVRNKRCLLALNKIDRIESAMLLEKVSNIIVAANALVGHDVFGWDRENVLLCSATLCFGISKTSVTNFCNSENVSLKSSVKFYHILMDKIEKGNTDNIIKKFGIKGKTKKSILSSILPLANCVFKLLDKLCASKKISTMEDFVYQTIPSFNLSSILTEFFADYVIIGYVGVAIFLEPKRYTSNNRVFITRLFESTLKKGMEVYAISKFGFASVRITNIYKFGVSEFIPIDEVSSSALVCLGGQFRKNSYILARKLCTDKEMTENDRYCRLESMDKKKKTDGSEFRIDTAHNLSHASECSLSDDTENEMLNTTAYINSPITLNALSPIFTIVDSTNRLFYRSKIFLKDLSRLPDLKLFFRTFVDTEQCLRICINKYNEVEIQCSGPVQFDKICYDLNQYGFVFTVLGPEYRFCEYVNGTCTETFENQKLRCTLSIGKDLVCEQNCWSDVNGNTFSIINDVEYVCENVLEMFVQHGFLIGEMIRETVFIIDLSIKDVEVNIGFKLTENEDLCKNHRKVGTTECDVSSESKSSRCLSTSSSNQSIDYDSAYVFVMSCLKRCYNKAQPLIAPIFYECYIHITNEYIGHTYNKLQNPAYTIKEEVQNEETGFYEIRCLIPQFLYSNFIEDIRICTKGTAYLQFKESGFICSNDFSSYIEFMKKRKGLFVDEKIVENPEKQRTLKK